MAYSCLGKTYRKESQLKTKNSRFYGLGFLLALAISASACAGAGDANEGTDSSAGTQQSATEDSAVGNDTLAQDGTSPEPLEAAEEAAITSEEFVRISLVNFSVSNEECSYGDGSLFIQAKLTNLTDRSILAAEVSATVTDVFGESIGRGYNISTDETIGPRAEANLGTWANTCFRLSDASGDDRRLLEIGSELETKTDLVIDVTRIAFDDGEVVEF